MKIHSSTTSVLGNPLHDPILHVRVLRREGCVDGRSIPLPLIERRDAGFGQDGVFVGDVRVDLVVGDGHLLIGIVDGKSDGPVAGEGLGGGVEVGDRDGVDPELGDAGAEDEPDDEDDRGRDYEEGDHGEDETAEEGGAGGGGRGGVVGVGVGVVGRRRRRMLGMGMSGVRAAVGLGIGGWRRGWVAGDGSGRIRHG